jgi:hypothetical protein
MLAAYANSGFFDGKMRAIRLVYNLSVVFPFLILYRYNSLKSVSFSVTKKSSLPPKFMLKYLGSITFLYRANTPVFKVLASGEGWSAMIVVSTKQRQMMIFLWHKKTNQIF